MPHGRPIPKKVNLHGDEAVAKRYEGIAESYLTNLEHELRLSGRSSGKMIKSPHPGVTIICTVIPSIGGGKNVCTCDIIVSQVTIEKEREEEFTDMRFFVRVGYEADVTYSQAGDVVEDNTRYYWIDWGTQAEEDIINILPIETIPKELLFYLVDTPTNYAQVKSFNLYYTAEDEVITRRFVAGYHWLNDDNDGERTLLAVDMATADEDILKLNNEMVNLPQASCDDGTGTNRFYANLDGDNMVAWYRVLQDWPAYETVHTEADSQISGFVSRIDYDEEEGEWGFNNNSFVPFEIGPLHVATATTHIANTPVREKACLFADIYELTSSTFKLNVALDHRPLLYNALTGGIEYPDELYAWEFTAEGFEQRLGMGYDYDDGGGYWKDTQVGTEQLFTAGGSCGDFTSQPECAAHAAMYNQWYKSWWTTYIFAAAATKFTVYPYHGGYGFFDGNKSEDFYTRIHERWGACSWNYGSGTCGGVAAHNCYPYRRTYWVAKGTGTNRFYGNTYGNNIHYGDYSTDISTWVQNNRYLSCSDDVLISSHATCSGAGSAVNDYDDWGLWTSRLSGGTPNHCNPTGGGGSVHTTAKSQWPSNNQSISDSCGSPYSISAMAYQAGTDRWEADDDGNSTNSTSQIDSFIVDGNYVYSEENVSSVRFLDDRTSEGTHGLVTAVKGKEIGEWQAVTHGEDGVTVITRNKYDELRTALIDGGFMLENELIHDIGLI